MVVGAKRGALLEMSHNSWAKGGAMSAPRQIMIATPWPSPAGRKNHFTRVDRRDIPQTKTIAADEIHTEKNRGSDFKTVTPSAAAAASHKNNTMTPHSLRGPLRSTILRHRG